MLSQIVIMEYVFDLFLRELLVMCSSKIQFYEV